MGLVWQGGGVTLCALLSGDSRAQPVLAFEAVLERAGGWRSPRESADYFRTVQPEQPRNLGNGQ
jgi:hypothetical protein